MYGHSVKSLKREKATIGQYRYSGPPITSAAEERGGILRS